MNSDYKSKYECRSGAEKKRGSSEKWKGCRVECKFTKTQVGKTEPNRQMKKDKLVGNQLPNWDEIRKKVRNRCQSKRVHKSQEMGPKETK